MAFDLPVVNVWVTRQDVSNLYARYHGRPDEPLDGGGARRPTTEPGPLRRSQTTPQVSFGNAGA